jgi:hypothetical protein
MNLYKLIFFLFILIIASCGKQKSVQTQLYTEDGMEVLNGHVKEIFSGDSVGRLNSYYKYDFAEKGDMKSSVKKTVDIAYMENETDTTISVDKRKYFFSRDKQGIVSSIKYKGLISGISGAYPNYSNILTFDKKGFLLTNGDPRDSVGVADITYYKCDTMGYLLESTEIHWGIALASDVNKYKYDNNHLLIEQTFYEDILLDKTTFEYKKFDENHNWIKIVCHSQSCNPGGHHELSTTIITRKITYY